MERGLVWEEDKKKPAPCETGFVEKNSGILIRPKVMFKIKQLLFDLF